MGHKSRLPVSVVGGCYVLKHKLGQGSFGKVYVAEHFKTGEEVAVKVEKLSNGNHMLAMEARILRRLQGLTGIVMVHHSGVEGEYRAMVTDLLGPSLEDVFTMNGRNFSLKTLLLLGQQMVRRLEDLHTVGIIHRDVKPDNFALGRGVQGNIVYLIDFGLAKQYYCPKAERHIPYVERRKGLTGTAQYASINAHLGVEQSRRDDIQALGYTLSYLLRGDLPWQKLEVGPKQVVLRQILEMKQSTSAEALCKGYSSVLVDFLRYASRLHFLDKPDYAFLRRVLKIPFDSRGLDGWMECCEVEEKVDESHDEATGSEEIPVGCSAGLEEIVDVRRMRTIVSL